MVFTRHDGFAAKILYGFEDAGVVRRDDDTIYAFSALDLFEDMLNQWFACFVSERLPGKAGGGIPGRDDGECLHDAFFSRASDNAEAWPVRGA